jgi:NAD(P)-dependent dehydrogenase (short-subunit alcohol dehydrogenase family)
VNVASVAASGYRKDASAVAGQAFLDEIPKPLGRVADPAEQASMLVFLRSRAASYLNGEVLWSGGGTVRAAEARELIAVHGQEKR